jgi:hypothetical protein
MRPQLFRALASVLHIVAPREKLTTRIFKPGHWNILFFHLSPSFPHQNSFALVTTPNHPPGLSFDNNSSLEQLILLATS